MVEYSQAAGAAPLTVEQFEALPQEDAYRIELVRGRMVREPRPGGVHGEVVMRLVSALNEHVRSNGLGRVLVETGFRLPGEQATVRGPDSAFIAAERLPPRPPVGFWTLAPDLAVEVVSPSDRWTAVEDKVEQYLTAGTRQVWVIDPFAGRAHIYGPGAHAQVLGAGDTIQGGDLLPGFRLALAELFGELL
ncbi:MAG: Uma2 family endonuclease [Longimicrobiales bacterium]